VFLQHREDTQSALEQTFESEESCSYNESLDARNGVLRDSLVQRGVTRGILDVGVCSSFQKHLQSGCTAMQYVTKWGALGGGAVWGSIGGTQMGGGAVLGGTGVCVCVCVFVPG